MGFFIFGGSVLHLPWPVCGGGSYDGRTEDDGNTSPAGGLRVYGNCKEDGAFKGYGQKLLQEERACREYGKRKNGTVPAGALPGMRKYIVTDKRCEAPDILQQNLQGEMVEGASGADQSESGVCFYLCLLREAFHSLWQLQTEILFP